MAKTLIFGPYVPYRKMAKTRHELDEGTCTTRGL